MPTEPLMDDRLDRLEQSVADLTRALRQIERRLGVLEARAGISEAPALLAASNEAGLVATSQADAVSILSLVGRTFVVLGGAYLLRALTDGGTLPRAGGSLLGFAYGVAWLVMAWRAAGTRRAVSAAFHGAAAALIAFPLLWEATVRFNLLTQDSAALAMGAVTLLGLTVAWHRRTQSLAWIITSAGLLTAVVFMAAGTAAGPAEAVPAAPAAGAAAAAVAEAAGESAAPMAFYLAFLGVVTLWLGYVLDWVFLRWPVAVVADLTVVVMVLTATQAWHRDQAGAVMALQTVLFAGYLVSFATRTLWRSREVVPFEVVQTVALLIVGFGGAVYLTLTTGSSATALGVAGLLFGAGSYGVAFAFVDWRRGGWKNFVFYASLGVVFILAGTALTVDATSQALVWSGLAVVSALAGRRQGTITLSSHAVIYAVAATITSGLLPHASDGFLAAAGRPWAPLLPAAVSALFAAALVSTIRLPLSAGVRGGWWRLPKIAGVFVFLVTFGGTVIALVVPWVTGQPGAGADPAVVAVVRTVVLGVSALVLGWFGRGLFPEGRWLMYVVLVIGALKLVIEDFPAGRPSTLFLALAVYGGALILGPRLVGRARAATTSEPQPPSPAAQA
jgi:hypothetical protein